MATLTDHLRTTYDEDTRHRKVLLDLIAEVVPTFIRFWNGGSKSWPYAVSEESGTPDEFSFSTHSMILLSLELLSGARESPKDASCDSILYPSTLGRIDTDLSKDDKSELCQIKKDADAKLFEMAAGPTPFKSSTFGTDDPLTLTWVWECCKRRPKSGDDSVAASLESLKNAAHVALERDKLLFWEDTTKGKSVVDHAFLHLRRNTLAKLAGVPEATPKKWFVDALHEQLAYSMIRDSRFDPATLAFCLEGSLQIDKSAFAEPTIKMVFSALEAAQQTSSHWRPTIPFISTETGMVLFPVSVEIANSLLRSCEILDAPMKDARYFIRLEPLIRRYFSWVQSRVVRGQVKVLDDVKRFVGWHSEHVNEDGLIHLWETSQVVLFLLHYASSLQRKLAIEGVQAANLSRRLPDSISPFPTYWKDEPLKALENDRYRVIEKTKKQFIDAGKKGAVLLYGPPGTGKTTYAEQMAVQLEWPLIVVTVTDFLEGGAAEVEARAKGVVQVLCEQSDVVILLDELDQFLLDRNSDSYKKQTGIFQFMTNGMLTKLQDLKDKKNCVFVVATNYFEKIDSAIRRRGRMDEYFLLTLPNCKQRLHLLYRFLTGELGEDSKVGKAGEEEFAEAARKVPASKKTKTEGERSLGQGTVFFSYNDLKYVVDLLDLASPSPALSKDTTVEDVVTALASKVPEVDIPVSLTSYEKRLDDEAFEEFFLLVYLLAEVEREPTRPEAAVISKAINEIGESDFEDFLKNLLKDDHIVSELESWRDKWQLHG